MALDEDRIKGKPNGLMGSFKQLDRLLRGELTGISALTEGGMGISALRLSVCIVILAMIYGSCMGTYAIFRKEAPNEKMLQVIASMIKVPLLFYLTLLVTLPSLYVFNALVGSRLSLTAMVRLLVASTGVIVTVLASLGPIVAFFSVSTTSYPFMLLFNVVVFAVSGFLGLTFLLQTLHRLSVTAPRPATPTSPATVAPPEDTPPENWASAEPMGPLEPVPNRVLSRHVKTVFRLWVVVFGLVGAQMGWVLRPFIGNPDLPFTWFRPRESNFFMAVLQALSHLFSS